MKRRCFAIPTRTGAAILNALLFAALTASINAQTRDHSLLRYDATKEATLSGTVSSVLTRPSPGMMMGSHLLLDTVSGTVDASLGRFALRGAGALSVAPGQQVQVTGVMKTLNDKQVFLVRTVKAGGQVYTIRNEHGIPVSSHTRERASGETAQKGETR